MNSDVKLTEAVNAELEDTIDLLELAQVLLKKWWLLLLSFVIGALVIGIGTKLFITPQYKATSMIYVYSKSTSITSLADLQIGSQLAVDFQIVATTREVMDKVAEKLGLDLTYEQMLKKTEITNPTGSHILKIVATNPDPELAAEISNTLADELRARIADVMNTDEPSMVDRAVIPSKPSSPSVLRNAVIGGAGLMFLLGGFYIVAFLMDDTIKTEDDVHKYLGLNILAEIPVERNSQKKKVS